MKTKVSLLPTFKPAKTNSAGLAPIVVRITVAGRRADLSTSIRVAAKDWSSARLRVLNSCPKATTYNAAITKALDQLTDLWADLERQGKPVTAQAIARAYRAGGASVTLLEMGRAYLAERTSLVGIEVAAGTVKSDQHTLVKLRTFLTANSLTQLVPDEVSQSLADKFLYWLLGAGNCTRNTANKHVRALVHMLRWGCRREYIKVNPLQYYSCKTPATKPIVFLGEEELYNLTHLPLGEGLGLWAERVRDAFILQCWTGLAYADLKKLNVAACAAYYTNQQGTVQRVLRLVRQKSKMGQAYECVIPLLPEAERVLAKYQDKVVLPKLATYNEALKTVGALARIAPDKMTSHVGRKTAGTLMLNRGIPLGEVSKFLGHSNTLITQRVYAKLLDTSVIDAFGAAFGSVPPLAIQPAAPRLLLPQTPTRPARRPNQ
jgi:integrase/recombinase XerD